MPGQPWVIRRNWRRVGKRIGVDTSSSRNTLLHPGATHQYSDVSLSSGLTYVLHEPCPCKIAYMGPRVIAYTVSSFPCICKLPQRKFCFIWLLFYCYFGQCKFAWSCFRFSGWHFSLSTRTTHRHSSPLCFYRSRQRQLYYVKIFLFS